MGNEDSASVIFEYVLVTVLAFFTGGWAIPVAVLIGLDPFGVWVAASLGSCLGVGSVVYFGWRGRDAVVRRLGGDGRSVDERARRIVDRWGVTGLALVGTVVFGPTLATLAALALNVDRRRFTMWALATTLAVCTVLTITWAVVVTL